MEYGPLRQTIAFSAFFFLSVSTGESITKEKRVCVGLVRELLNNREVEVP